MIKQHWKIVTTSFEEYLSYKGNLYARALGVFSFTVFSAMTWMVLVAVIAIFAVVLTQVLLGVAQTHEVVYAVCFTASLLIGALLLWRAGLRRYDSASS